MDYEKIRNDEDFHKWHEYEPNDSQYVRYAAENSSIIAAAHKIVDVYYSFANARCSFMDAGAENYGDISSNDELSIRYTKSHFLRCAVLEYGLCLDICWQVIWAYIYPSSLEALMKNEYKKIEKKCTKRSVHYRLKNLIAQGQTDLENLKKLLSKFEKDKDIKKLRTLYNSLKHHGTIHFQGLGANFASMMMSVEGSKIPTLSRESYTFENIEDLLYKYHFKFKKYFNKIIQSIIPEDYFNNTVPFGEYISTILQMKKTLDDN